MKEQTLRVSWCAFSFILCLIAKSVTIDFLGFLLVPFGIWFGSVKTSSTTGVTAFNPPKLLWLWGNDEEGYDAPKSYELYPNTSNFKRRYRWAALRNRSDNLQFTWFCPPPVPGRVGVIKFPNGGFVAWQGWRHYVWSPVKIGKITEVSFGWNYYPTDNTDPEKIGIRKFGCAFGGKITR